jgi:hypothetical protein
MSEEQAFEVISTELKRAISLWPGWPEDKIHVAGIIVEEAGESMQAALDYVYSGGSIEHMREEIIQTGAMCLRALMNL